MDEIIEVKVNKKLYARFCALCAEYGWDPEDITRRFFEWCVQEPEKAKNWLQSAMEEEERRQELLAAIPRVPMDGIVGDRFDAVFDFVDRWAGPVCLEFEGTPLIAMTVGHYEENFGRLPGGSSHFDAVSEEKDLH